MTNDQGLYLIAALEEYCKGKISRDDISRVLRVLKDLKIGPITENALSFERAMKGDAPDGDAASWMARACSELRQCFERKRAVEG